MCVFLNFCWRCVCMCVQPFYDEEIRLVVCGYVRYGYS